MIEHFEFFNTDNIIVPVSIGFGLGFFDNVDNVTFSKFYNGSRKGLRWGHKGRSVEIFDNKGSVTGYPSTDLKYVIAIYSGANCDFKEPKNAIVYNCDGSIHKILTPPPFKSKLLLEKLKINKDQNPPINLNYDGALWFKHVAWGKSESEQIVTVMQIGYDKEWVEYRVLDHEKGEFGECLGSGRI